MSGLDHAIAATLSGVGEGIAGLRDAGALVEMIACSIEVHIEEHGPPAARLVIDLRTVSPADGEG